MFSDLSAEAQDSVSHYPITDSHLSFAEYIQQCQAIIADRREDLHQNPTDRQKILDANSPFEYQPTTSTPGKAGALMIHGLLDCPFTYREMGAHLQSQGILARALLLPGHGTRPSDLLHVTYHDWLQAVRYGVESLKKEVDSVFLIGYSTGAALSIYQALQDSGITGIILISPAIKVRLAIDLASNLHHLTNYLGRDHDWITIDKEDNYAKYRSITYNSVTQVTKLSDTIREMANIEPIKQPMYMILSREDETISSKDAIEFFSSMHHPASKMLLYTSTNNTYPDARINIRKSIYPELNIAHLSHACMTFSAKNQHYGLHGDYSHASEAQHEKFIDGAYNRIEIQAFEMMAKYNLVEHQRRVLTYNPDFGNMAESIATFITDNVK
jgi:esterase/lipase